MLEGMALFSGFPPFYIVVITIYLLVCLFVILNIETWEG